MNIKNIGLSTSAFGYTMGSTGKNTDRKNPQPWTLEQFIEFAAGHGFGGVEAPLRRFVSDLDPVRIERIRSMLSERQMFFIMDAESALDIEEITALIPYANAFGSPIIRIKSSNILGCDRKKLGRPWHEHVQHCSTTLKGLAPKLREHGLRIAIENHQDLDSNDLRQIIDAVGTDVVGVTFDIGNAFSVCEDPLSFAEKLGPAILNIHIKDYKIYRSGEGIRLVRCPVGEGSVDFKSLLLYLMSHAPEAKMVIELGALEARNVAWRMEDFWKEIQPRPQSELVPFFQKLASEEIIVPDNSWMTPWETGAGSAEILEYEQAELEVSKKYLTTI